MYKTITQIPTREQIKKYNMKITEEDAFINYKADLSQLDETLQRTFSETFQVNFDALKEKQSVTLTHSREV
ncbi:MAG: hypothetical protein MUP09_01450 [Thiovulaceae bacterium]|nr:hypothetical protein [Sulfurimonadaceae bacterium]